MKRSTPSRLEQMGQLLTAAIAVMLAGDSGLQKKRRHPRPKIAKAIYSRRANHFPLLIELGVCSKEDLNDCRRGFSDDMRIRAALHICNDSANRGIEPGFGSDYDAWLNQTLGLLALRDDFEEELDRDLELLRAINRGEPIEDGCKFSRDGLVPNVLRNLIKFDEQRAEERGYSGDKHAAANGGAK